MWAVISCKDTQRVAMAVVVEGGREVGSDSWSSDKMQEQCSAPCWTGEFFLHT